MAASQGAALGTWDVQDRGQGMGWLPAAQNTRKVCGGAGAACVPTESRVGEPCGHCPGLGDCSSTPDPFLGTRGPGVCPCCQCRGWQCPVPVWAAWADPGLEHCSMGWVRSCRVGEEPWDGRGAAPAVFAEPTLCPSLRVVESSANTAESCVTSAGGGCWSLGFCHPGARCSGVHGAGTVCPGVGLASFWPGVTVLLLLHRCWSWDPGKY